LLCEFPSRLASASFQPSFLRRLGLRNTRLLVQGLTGREGTFHAKQAAAYGTNVVGGVRAGKGGTTHEGWPIFNTVADAVKATAANATLTRWLRPSCLQIPRS
jgi:succinyl-CoA synthetase alpha subunit